MVICRRLCSGFQLTRTTWKINTFFLVRAFVSAPISYAAILFSLRAFLSNWERSEMLRKRAVFPPLALFLPHGQCKLNSFCMFEESSQITRSSLRLSLFNCPSISGVVVVPGLLRWLSQSQTPSRDFQFDVAELEEPQTSAERSQKRRCDLGYFCRAFKPSERQQQPLF